MKDFRLKIKVQNNRLISLIDEQYGSQAEMARQTGLNFQKINGLVTMRLPAMRLDGWSGLAMDVATALGVSPSEIWPEHMREVRLRSASAEMHLDMEEVRAITGTDATKVVEWRDMLARAIKALPEREANVVRMRYILGMTLEEIGKEIGVNRERARQIECRGLRKMKRELRLRGISDERGPVVT